ncbi:uncharacterized protein LOC124887880 [Capsicum annuum]|uniref:uncharacterized protein LOC124887880 n=1 Tax=Capsicum annuum TaxID=4072 RepID=UPI001FB0BC64|nr:uncharacterized protein LOC124887880 [Capsicum annuum]
MLQREKFAERNANALAAARVSGVDSIEQITNRCIYFVKNAEEAEFIACVLCRAYDFSKPGFGPWAVILCDQELPKGKCFCSTNCKRIYSALQNLLNSGEERLPDSCLDATRMETSEWKSFLRETRRLLAKAVSIFHDGFNPIVDSVTGRDFSPFYGLWDKPIMNNNLRSSLTDQCSSTVVSAGILRIFGQDMAELPLVATRVGSKGILSGAVLLHRKIACIFEHETLCTPQLLLKNGSYADSLISFKGTSMLEKMVPKCRINNNSAG